MRMLKHTETIIENPVEINFFSLTRKALYRRISFARNHSGSSEYLESNQERQHGLGVVRPLSACAYAHALKAMLLFDNRISETNIPNAGPEPHRVPRQPT